MKVYDQKDNFVRFILRRRDFRAEEKLEGGIARKQISLSYPLEDGRIPCEYIIEYGDDRYRVKESQAKGLYGSVVAEQDTAELEGNVLMDFSGASLSLTGYVAKALYGTGWNWKNVSADDTETRDISEENLDSMSALEKVAEVFWVEMELNAGKKVVYLYKRVGNASGTARFMKGFNLKTLEVKTDTHDFYTRIYPVGKDGVTISSVNDGKEYLDDNRYSDEVRAVIWEDSNYADASQLKEAAKRKLEELSAPKITYAAQIADVAQMLEGYEDFAFFLGDEVDVVDPGLDVNTRERIVRIVRCPDHPEKNTVELSSRKTSFSDMQKKLLAAVSSAANGGIVIKGKALLR